MRAVYDTPRRFRPFGALGRACLRRTSLPLHTGTELARTHRNDPNRLGAKVDPEGQDAVVERRLCVSDHREILIVNL